MKLLKEFGLSEKQIESFELYSKLLLEWNEKFNLTAITDPEQIEEKHFIDSLMSLNYVNFNDKSLIDIGSGAGFPGVVLAIAVPSLKVTLLESNGKKVSFLKEVVSKLNLNNVIIIQGRAEELGLRENFDFVTARAVKELNILLEISFYMLKVGGAFVAYKSINIDKEIENAKRAFKCLQITDFKKYEYQLPKSKDNRVLLEILKKNKTLKKYPRKYGDIVKSPL